MKRTKLAILLKVVALALIVSLILPTTSLAATQELAQPRASYYLTSYNTYICAVGGGDIQIWFEVMGTDDMDELGTLSIKLYESSDNSNWTLVETFLHEDYEEMLMEDDYFYMNYVPYEGTARKYYKAYVCIWAGKNGGGDTRYMWATSVRAT